MSEQKNEKQTPDAQIKKLKAQLSAVKEEFEAEKTVNERMAVEVEETKTKLSNALALAREYKQDMERMRERSKEVEQTKTKEVAEKTILALLPVLDNLELSLTACKDEQVKKGFALVEKQFSKVLENMGAEKIDTNCEFNPELHEAISMLPSPDKKHENKIAHVLKSGYTYCGKTIRAAQVVVYSNNG